LGVGRLSAFLRRHRLIALDTSIFIYQLDANARYVPFTDLIFRWVEAKGHAAITSTVTMTELLVRPYREGGHDAVDRFYSVLSRYPNLEWLPVDLRIADIAARLRAEFGLRTPDALQAATAAHGKATGFLTNDPVFNRLDVFEALLVDDLF
jgi:predicted nucleic acid-binding protein